MSERWSANKLYFDEASRGISGGVYSDDSKNWDADAASIILCLSHLIENKNKLIFRESGTLRCKTQFVGIEDYSNYVDLIKLVPEKFRGSTALQELLYVFGLESGSWIGKINDLQSIIDKYQVGDDYIQYLADLVGLQFIVTPATTLEDKRRQLIQVIDWYKMKGTYEALQVIQYTLDLNINLWDMYTNDYSTFVPVPWYTGKINTNPTGSVTTEAITGTSGTFLKTPIVLGSVVLTNGTETFTDVVTPGTLVSSLSAGNSGTVTSGGVWSVTGWTGVGSRMATYKFSMGLDYYKSPHFGIEVCLNQVYGSASASYLFDGDETYTSLVNYVERVRPINVVPHYTIFLNPVTTQSGAVYMVDGNIYTIALGDWTPSQVNYDDATSAGAINKYDNNQYYDYTTLGFYNNITIWGIGTGNKNVIPDSSFTMENPVLTNFGGSINAPITVNVQNTYVDFSFQLPSTLTNTSLSELGLYYADGTTIMLGCTFPNIDLVSGIALRVLIRVYY